MSSNYQNCGWWSSEAEPNTSLKVVHSQFNPKLGQSSSWSSMGLLTGCHDSYDILLRHLIWNLHRQIINVMCPSHINPRPWVLICMKTNAPPLQWLVNPAYQLEVIGTYYHTEWSLIRFSYVRVSRSILKKINFQHHHVCWSALPENLAQ